MIDLAVVGSNLLTILILGFFGWVIYQGMKGNNALGSFKSKFGKVLGKSKFK